MKILKNGVGNKAIGVGNKYEILKNGVGNKNIGVGNKRIGVGNELFKNFFETFLYLLTWR